MTKLDLTQLTARYLVMHEELTTAPELKNNPEFMERYHKLTKQYHHYATHRINYESIRKASDEGVIR
jgi:hypothetical protein